MLPYIHFELGQLAQKCTDPTRAVSVMKELMGACDQYITATVARDFLDRLVRLGLATNDVTNAIGNISKSYKRTRSFDHLLLAVMKSKVKDAQEDLVIRKSRFLKAKRLMEKSCSNVHLDVMALVRQHKTTTWCQSRRKASDKVHFLLQKRRPKQLPGTVEGIRVGDDELGPRGPLKDLLIWGSDELKSRITPDMEEVLRMPPKTSIATRIDLLDMEVELEKAFTKQRWDFRSNQQTRQAQIDGDHRTMEEILVDRSIHNPVTGVVSLEGMNATDFKTNRDMILPQPCNAEIEAQFQSVKQEILSVVKDYTRDNCDSKGMPKETPFPRSAELGIKGLMDLKKSEDVVFMCSDKSDTMTVNTKSNYDQSGLPHLQESTPVDAEFVKTNENVLNHHTYQIARVFGIGANKGPSMSTRIKSALFNDELIPPVLYCPPKDHKPLALGRELEGPPSRPVCGARLAPNGQLSAILSHVVNAACDKEKAELGTKSKSTEDVIAAIDEFNNRVRPRQHPSESLALGSMDCIALYPSCKIQESAVVVQALVTKYADSFLDNINWEEASRYIALTHTPGQINALGLKDVVHYRKSRRGTRPGITTKEVGTALHLPIQSVESLFISPDQQPSDAQKALMLGVVVKTAVIAAMSGHVFRFNGTTYVQDDGGAMGNELTVAIARSVMLKWDRQFKQLCTDNLVALLLYRRYVDDQLGVYAIIAPGYRWSTLENAIIFNGDMVDEDTALDPAARTLGVIKDMANSISPDLQMTLDCPGPHNSGRMPVLDLEVWLDGTGEINYEFYRKPIRSEEVILNSSILSDKVKRTVFVQEGIRILRNCRESLPWSNKTRHLEALMQRLKNSGYPHRYRVQILQCVLAGYRGMVEKQRSGKRPVNRPDLFESGLRAKRKLLKGKLWHKRGGYSTVLFVPATPGSTLARMIRTLEARNNQKRSWRMRVVEGGGRSLKSILQKSDPNPPVPCSHQNCPICISGKLGICSIPGGVNYAIICVTCRLAGTDFVYYGESSKCIRIRYLQHLADLFKRNSSKPLWKHACKQHDGVEPVFELVINQFTSDCLTRLIREGVLISSAGLATLMNSRSEWKQPGVGRVLVLRLLPH